ncbi:MAG UNVERIFIED_CONTAM: hypothetical protein LVR29_16670 [Microcystis novacekii LVE1205-3]|jgi:hypothetical protein
MGAGASPLFRQQRCFNARVAINGNIKRLWYYPYYFTLQALAALPLEEIQSYKQLLWGEKLVQKN